VILTDVTIEKNMDAAIAELEALSAITGNIIKIRMEELGRN
jgi:homoserine dehydrogenase